MMIQFILISSGKRQTTERALNGDSRRIWIEGFNSQVFVHLILSRATDSTETRLLMPWLRRNGSQTWLTFPDSKLLSKKPGS
jgi:hypothetical protein